MRRVTASLLVCSLSALALQACSLNAMEGALGVAGSVRGELTVHGPRTGDLVLRPETCASGDRASFRGVDLPAAPLVVRLAADPLEGLGVALIDSESGERRGVFHRGDRAALRGDVQRTGWRVNTVADVSGFLELDCQLPTGEQVSGSIVFEHCH